MNSTTTPVFAAAQLQAMGIRELEQLVYDQKLRVDQAFDIVEARCAKRDAEKRPQVARVVYYRNVLARSLGKPERQVPNYIAKVSTPATLSFTDTNDIEAMADQIKATGVEIPTLMAALAKRIHA